MEALADILSVLRIRSSLISHGRFSAPWSVSTAGSSGAVFHAVVSGTCWVRLARGGARQRVELSAGDVALVSRGDPHVACSALRVAPQPIAGLPHDESVSGVPRLQHGGGGARTDVVCGSFVLDHAASDVLTDLLPPLVRIPGSTDRSRWLAATLELLTSELDAGLPGRDVVVSRLAEVLVVHLLRAHLLSLSDASGLIGGLRDPQVGRALAHIHGEPAREWTVDELAREVGMSRAAFYARFGELVGETPARYLASWRMRAAADILTREQSLAVAQVAQRVGYRSEDAFTRAFKRFTGSTPRQYRREPTEHVA